MKSLQNERSEILMSSSHLFMELWLSNDYDRKNIHLHLMIIMEMLNR